VAAKNLAQLQEAVCAAHDFSYCKGADSFCQQCGIRNWPAQGWCSLQKNSFEDPRVAAVFNAYSAAVQQKLLAIRRAIFEAALSIRGAGGLQEALRWGQPSYLTSETGSGITIRIDQVRYEPGKYCICLT
jgi:hypothetical protein